MYYRCEALNFKITKSQKKILKRMGKYLRNELQKDDLMDTTEGERDNIGRSIDKFFTFAFVSLNDP